MKKQTINLNGNWILSGTDKNGQKIEIPASVPGCVHTDLRNEKLICSDIFMRDNAKGIQWIEDKNWIYTKNFEVTELFGGAELCFDGLDVYCDIYLNDKHLGYCDDMFIPHRFCVDGILKKGENTLSVYFYSPINMVSGKKTHSGAFTTERLNTRRIQCSYGWDWVYRFVTCGIFRPVYIEFKNDIYVESVYITTESIDEYSAQISYDISFGKYCSGGTCVCELYSPDGTLLESDTFYTEEPRHIRYFDIAEPMLWKPWESCDQPLYTIRINLNGELQTEQKFGIRTVKLLQLVDTPESREHELSLLLKKDSPSADEYDFNDKFSCFTVVINGKKVFCKGANWVPCEPFPSAESKEKITRILELSKAAGVNMIRIWGGGLFECDHFYSECDRLGIMVTQDFLMACGAYPEDDAHFVELLKKEAAYAALTLRNHPCLVWWTGDNENAVNGSDKMSSYMGRISAHKAIAPELRKYDPHRRFLPSSPYGGDRYASKTAGTTHNTQYLSFIFDYIENGDGAQYKEYFSKYLARFVAEEPAMGACSLSTLRRFMTDDDIFGQNTDMWYFHTQSNPALKIELLDYNLIFAEKVLGTFENSADKFFKLKYIGYEWIRFTLENFRRNQWYSSGILYWMLNDCWPASSGWALIDYYCKPKALYYSFKRCAKPYMLSISESDGVHTVHFCSNSYTEDRGTLTVTGIEQNGTAKMVCSIPCSFGENTVKSIILPDMSEYFAVICEYSSEKVRDRAFYKKGSLRIKKCGGFTVTAKSQNSITIKASEYIHAVELEADAVFEDNYFSLLPGEERTIYFTASEDSVSGSIDVECYTLDDMG